MSISELWTEKYRPDTTDGYVFNDATHKSQVDQWINEKSIPHVLFSGSPGTGKTTLAKILIKALEIDEYDILSLNASRERGIDIIRKNIQNFSSTMPFGKMKIVLLDEADYLTGEAQASLRGTMEEYAHTVRFILTCNHPNKILPALHSRCQSLHFEKLDKTEFTARAATVLVDEGVDFDLDTLDTFVSATYPDLRKCLNLLQLKSIDNKLATVSNAEVGGSDFKLEMIELFKAGKAREARKLLCSKISPDEIDEMYRWLYNNLQLFGSTEEEQDEAILIIRKGLVNHALVADPEINLSATLIELSQIGN